MSLSKNSYFVGIFSHFSSDIVPSSPHTKGAVFYTAPFVCAERRKGFGRNPWTTNERATASE